MVTENLNRKDRNKYHAMGSTFKPNFYEINDMFSTEKKMKRYFLKDKALGVHVTVFQSIQRKLKKNV